MTEKEKWSKDRTKERLMERYESGKSMRYADISKDDMALYQACNRLFGKYSIAVEEIGLDYSEIKKRREWTKELIIDSIKLLHKQGKSLQYSDVCKVDYGLVGATLRHFGSYKEAVESAGFDYHDIMTVTQWDKEAVINEIRDMRKKGIKLNAAYIRDNYPKLDGASRRLFGTWATAIESSGISYDEISHCERYDEDSIVAYIKGRVIDGSPLNPKSIESDNRKRFSAIRRHFGSYENLLEHVGVEYNNVKLQKSWNPELVISSIKDRVKNGESIACRKVRKDNCSLHNAGVNHFGSWKRAVEESGVNYGDVSERRFWDRSKIINEINKRFIEGYKLSTNIMMREDQYLLTVASKTFGSWEDAVNASGLSYDTIREDRNRLAFCGFRFERILDNLFTDLGINYKKYHHKTLKPDYVLGNEVWIDAKLSEWTAYNDGTINKYKNHCRMLNIVFFRGACIDVMVDKSTRLTSVSYYVKQLPKGKRDYYENLLKGLSVDIDKLDTAS